MASGVRVPPPPSNGGGGTLTPSAGRRADAAVTGEASELPPNDSERWRAASAGASSGRSKQYVGNRTVTVGGISLSIDADLVASAVARG